MDNKIIILVCVVVLIVVGVACASIFTNTQEESSLAITSNATLYDGDNCTVKLTNDENIGIANKTINVTLTNENGTSTNFEYVTDNEGVISFNISDVGNYSIKCVFDGDDNYKSSNASQDVSVKQKVENTSVQKSYESSSSKDSSQSNYYEDDHLSCEQLKAKYPEMSDEELFEKFGERGENGIMYTGDYVWEDRGDGISYGGHPLY